MDHLDEIFSCSIPIVSALTWAMIMLFAVRDSANRLEKQVKTILVWYFLFTASGWGFLTVYIYVPELAPYVNAVGLFCMLVPVILFYHFVYALTVTGKEDSFPKWHYAVPVLICLVLQVWSFFVPAEVDVDLFKGRGIIAQEHKVYSYFFLSKPQLRLVFSGIYTCLIVLRIWTYYKRTGRNNALIRKPQRWFILLISLAFTLFLISMVGVLLPRGEIFSPVVVANYIVTLALHITIGYNVIRRNFLLYVPLQLREEPKVIVEEQERLSAEREECRPADSGKRTYRRHAPVRVTAAGKSEFGKLTRKEFEAYIRKHKPYLDPQLKITDLVEPLRTNRTVLSGFVNKTYGVNFNRYINRLRLEELERLRLLPANAKKDDDVLIAKAGFACRRNYTRALDAERRITDTNDE